MCVDLSITFHVAANLLPPERRAIYPSELLIEALETPDAPGISVPEVTVHKDRDSLGPERDVGLPEDGSVVDTIAVPEPEEGPSQIQLGLGVLAANRGHDSGRDRRLATSNLHALAMRAVRHKLITCLMMRTTH